MKGCPIAHRSLCSKEEGGRIMKKAFAGAAGIALAAVLLAGPVSAASGPGAGQDQKKQDAGKSQQEPKKAKNLSKRNKAKIEQSKEAEKRRTEIKKEQSK